jgi:glycosyltransferase involved in cell wall biosynthesis
VQNPDDRDLLVGAGRAARESVRLIRGSGVNTDLFRPAARAAGRELRVLLATRLLWDKGVGEFIAAARSLKCAGVAADFLIAGASDPGNPSAVPEEQILRWSEEGVVRALGHVEDMPGLLAAVDLVVLPSYREGVPRILIEAAASGLPIVTTDVPGCREIVEHEVNGLRVPARDAQSLAAAMRRLIEDPDKRVRFGRTGRRKVLAEFDERNVIASTLKVYDELLRRAPARPLLSSRVIRNGAGGRGTSIL